MEELKLPAFLEEKDVNQIHSQMLEQLPEDLDKSQGQHVYNLTRPTALIAAELCQQTLPNLLYLIFPMWAYGQWLDYHAQIRGISRRGATASAGTLELTLKAALDIPAGTQFSTASIDGRPAVVFQTMQDEHLKMGKEKVNIVCTETGTAGNVIAHTVVFKLSRLDAITAVDNPADITGGTEIETDDSLRERILGLDGARSISYVGSVADYKRWSHEIAGVGDVTVISAQDDSGLVTVVITDSNGDPANEALCQAVYNHIMSPENPELRLTAPNAKLLVLPPETIELSISAIVTLAPTSSLEAVTDAFLSAVRSYLATARTDREIRITQIGKILASIPGVYDYTELCINNQFGNIPITAVQLPQTNREHVILTTEAIH